MTFFSILIFVVLVIIVFSLWWYVSMPKNLPPGPKGLPVIGCVLSAAKEEAHILLEKWTKEYGPVVSFYMANKLVVLLGNYEAIEEGLVKQADVYSGRPYERVLAPGDAKERKGVIGIDGAEWKEQRRFSLTTLRDFGFGRPILQNKISEETDYLLSDIASFNGEPFDIQMSLSKAVSNVICSMVFGHRFEDPEFWNNLQRLNYRISQSRMTFLTPIVYFSWVKDFPIIKRKFQKFQQDGRDHVKYMSKVMKETAASFNPVDEPSNYVHAFMKAQNDKVGQFFTQHQLEATVGQLFAAGSETTSSTLRWGVYLVTKNPDIQEKVYNEISDAVGVDQLPVWEDRTKLPYTEACIMEIQRMANLVPLSLLHRTTEPSKLMGYDIPADAWVIPLLWNVLKDSKHFPNPDRFEPTRFLDENNKIKKEAAFIPFSAGKRICLGESLAKMELFIFFTSMIVRFKFAFSSDEPEPTVKRVAGITMTPSNFKICATKRQDF